MSIIPTVDVPSVDFLEPDKIVHVIFYMILTLLICRGWIGNVSGGKLYGKLLIAFIISTLYGGFIEFVQEYLASWRSGDLYDFAADGLGSVLGTVIFTYFYRPTN